MKCLYHHKLEQYPAFQSVAHLRCFPASGLSFDHDYLHQSPANRPVTVCAFREKIHLTFVCNSAGQYEQSIPELLEHNEHFFQ